MSKFDELVKVVEDAKGDADKFYTNGNKAAGTRLRNFMLDLKKAAQEVRVEVQEKKEAA
jgi:hypothetical protein